MEVNGAPELLCFPHSSEYLHLCSAEQRHSYRFGTTVIIYLKSINIPSLLRQNDWFVREIDMIAVSVCRKALPVCCSLCANSKNAASRSLTSALVVKCHFLLCVSWSIASCCCEMLLALVCLVTDCVMLLWNVIGSCVSRDRLRHATVYAFEWWSDVSALMERDHFQRLKPYVLLFSLHKDFVCLQKTWNATRLVFNAFILLVYGQFLQ